MATISDLIQDALGELNIKSELETYRTEDIVHARATTDYLMQEWHENESINFFKKDDAVYEFSSAAVPTYSAASTYALGAIALRDADSTDRYICTTAISVAEAFDISKWTLTNRTFVLPSKYYDVVSASIRYGGLDSDLEYISDSEYQELSNKENTGKPTHYCLRYKSDLSVEVNLYPQPDLKGATGYLFSYTGILNHISYTSNSDTVGFPNNAYLAIKWGLALELANRHKVSDQSYARIVLQEEKYKKRLKKRNTGFSGVRTITPAI